VEHAGAELPEGLRRTQGIEWQERESQEIGMSFNRRQKKGLNNYLVDSDLADDCLSLHISELAPGKNSHEPHVQPKREITSPISLSVTLDL